MPQPQDERATVGRIVSGGGSGVQVFSAGVQVGVEVSEEGVL